MSWRLRRGSTLASTARRTTVRKSCWSASCSRIPERKTLNVVG